jgi:hypothetical protein
VEHGIDLAATHIPGLINKLADALSRFQRNKDFSDWAFRDDLFYTYQELLKITFTIDGAADILGTNDIMRAMASGVQLMAGRHTTPKSMSTV